MPRNFGMTPKQRRRLSDRHRIAFFLELISLIVGGALLLHGAAHLIEVLRHG